MAKLKKFFYQLLLADYEKIFCQAQKKGLVTFKKIYVFHMSLRDSWNIHDFDENIENSIKI